MKHSCKWSQPFHGSTGLENQSLVVTRSVPFLHHSDSAFHLLLLQSFSSACDPVCWLDDVKINFQMKLKPAYKPKSWFVSVSLLLLAAFCGSCSSMAACKLHWDVSLVFKQFPLGMDNSDTSTTKLLRLPLPNNSQGS